MFRLTPVTTAFIVGGAVVGTVAVSAIAYQAFKPLWQAIEDPDHESPVEESEKDDSFEKEMKEFLSWRKKKELKKRVSKKTQKIVNDTLTKGLKTAQSGMRTLSDRARKIWQRASLMIMKWQASTELQLLVDKAKCREDLRKLREKTSKKKGRKKGSPCDAKDLLDMMGIRY